MTAEEQICCNDEKVEMRPNRCREQDLDFPTQQKPNTDGHHNDLTEEKEKKDSCAQYFRNSLREEGDLHVACPFVAKRMENEDDLATYERVKNNSKGPQ